ncbi:hypothetical protein [Paenibacillus ginsengarvi]|uniref:hypothetical protein n=1 Tax=Paenibacillus ginsengarvi TaxID=400777 RepID=UPI001875AF7E|nr:hypothetical protein [Paenibacillus ginsengarvi]
MAKYRTTATCRWKKPDDGMQMYPIRHKPTRDVRKQPVFARKQLCQQSESSSSMLFH